MEDSTQARIIKATLCLMGKKEGKEISVREILNEAGLSNMSAISYHFGSKEKLIKQALQWYYEEMYTVLSASLSKRTGGKEVLMQLAKDFWTFSSRNPGLEKTMVTQMIMRTEPDPDFQLAAQRNLSVVIQLIQQATGLQHEKELIYRAIAFMSGIVYPFLLKHYGFKDLENDSEAALNDYFSSLVDSAVR
jgi:AcrR family transcriptional regulator